LLTGDGTRRNRRGYECEIGIPSGGRSTRLATRAFARLLEERFSTAALVVASSVLLSWVALFNRFPLVFPDTLSYATTAFLGEIPGMFSAYYSFLILPLHRGATLWPVVFVQAAMLAHLLYLVVRCVAGGAGARSATLVIIAALCLLSSLPWITGQVMPDVFSSVVLLGLFLLAFCSDRLSRRELVYVGALTTVAIATHLSHVPIALGLIVLSAVLRVLFATKRIGFRRWAALLLLPLAVATGAMLAVSWVNARTIAFARNSNVFLLAKWIEEGPALAYLEQACPTVRYSLCAYIDQMRGMYQDDLKWWGGSPFYKVGGLDGLEPEARRIVSGTLRIYPGEILTIAAMNSGRQLLRFGIGEGLTPESAKLVAPYIGEVFGPEVEQSLLRSRQAKGSLPIAEFRRLHLAALLFSLGLALSALVTAREWVPARLGALAAYVAAGILGSAAVTGALSGPFDRYLARMAWLVPFVALLGAFCRVPVGTREVRGPAGGHSSMKPMSATRV
jgi:hypothetical protein